MRNYLQGIGVLVRRSWIRSPRLRLAARIHFYGRLSLYLRSGIPIRDALGFIVSSADTAGARAILTTIYRLVLEGTSLSQALNSFPETFPVFEVRFIEIGEHSGSLPESLSYLTALLSRKRSLSRRMRGALIYPLLILISTFGITAFLLLHMFPKIVPIFKGLDVPLPLATRVLIEISDTFVVHGRVVIAVGCVVGTLCVVLARQAGMQRRAREVLLVMPLLGNLVRAYHLALFSRTLSSILKTGIPLIPAMVMLSAGMRHPEYRAALDAAYARVSTGRPLADGLKASPKLFPHTLVELVSAGESSGSLTLSLNTAAELYEEELDEKTRELMTLIEPALMVAMGLLVGFIALAIIAPIYGISQDLTPH